MLVFRPHQRDPEVTDFDAEPPLAEVEAIVGGPLRQVPGFLSIEYDCALRRCVALCLQTQNPKEPVNGAATILWDQALRRDMGVGLIRRDGTRADHLTGTVVVFFARY